MGPNAKPVPESQTSCQRWRGKVPSPTQSPQHLKQWWGEQEQTPPTPDRLLKGNKTFTLPPPLWTDPYSHQYKLGTLRQKKPSSFLMYNIQTLNTKPFPNKPWQANTFWCCLALCCPYLLCAKSPPLKDTADEAYRPEAPAPPLHLHKPTSRSSLHMLSDDKSPSGG